MCVIMQRHPDSFIRRCETPPAVLELADKLIDDVLVLALHDLA